MHVTYTVQKTEFAPATRMIEHRPMWRFYSMTMLYHATLRSHRQRSRISATTTQCATTTTTTAAATTVQCALSSYRP